VKSDLYNPGVMNSRRLEKQNKEELHNLYPSPNIIRMMKSSRLRWSGHVERIGEKRDACRVLMEKSEGKRPVGRPRRRWVDNIKIDFRGIGWGDMGWIRLLQDRDQWRALVNVVMDHRIPQNLGNFLIS
jgi:hypothetical protein